MYFLFYFQKLEKNIFMCFFQKLNQGNIESWCNWSAFNVHTAYTGAHSQTLRIPHYGFNMFKLKCKPSSLFVLLSHILCLSDLYIHEHKMYTEQIKKLTVRRKNTLTNRQNSRIHCHIYCCRHHLISFLSFSVVLFVVFFRECI